MENTMNQSIGIDQLLDSILQDEKNQSIISTADYISVGPEFDFVNASMTDEVSHFIPIVVESTNESQSNVDPLSKNQELFTPSPNSTIDCSCVVFHCKNQMDNLRDHHRLALQRKNYILRQQQKVIRHYETRLGRTNPNQQAMEMSQITLPCNLPATQMAMHLLTNKKSRRTMYEMTYVIRGDPTVENYKIACFCPHHQCQRKLRMIEASQLRTNQHKNWKIVQNEKLLEFYESSH